MASFKSHKTRIIRALKGAGRYTPCVGIQIDALATALMVNDKALKQIEKLEDLTITEISRYGEKTVPHPICKIANDAQASITKQMATLGLTVEDIMGEPDLPDAVDELNETLDAID